MLTWFAVERAAFRRGGLIAGIYHEHLPGRLLSRHAKRDGLEYLVRIDGTRFAGMSVHELMEEYACHGKLPIVRRNAKVET